MTRRLDPLRALPLSDLRRAESAHVARIAAIDAGTAPATPDSRPNAEQLLKRVRREIARRGQDGA